MEYRNFEMRLIPLSDNNFSVVVTDSPHGCCSEHFTLPPGLEHFRIGSSDSSSCVRRELAPEPELLMQPKCSPSLDPEEVGRQLFSTVFGGKVGDLFKKCHDPNYGIRIMLVLQEAVRDHESGLLHALPWELLFYDQHLGVSPNYSIVRQLDGALLVERALVPIIHPFKPRVLLVGSNPNDTHPLDLEREQHILTELSESSAIEVEQLRDISLRGLHDKLEEGFHVIHFMGHGDWQNGQPVLFFLDKFGDAEGVSGRQLAEEIRGLTTAQSPRLFVLNACHGGAVALGPFGLTGIAAELDKAGIPAVISMRHEIGDDAAICFSRNFYADLAMGLSLDEAMARARLALKREANLAPDWATPSLFSNLGEGALFPRQPTSADDRSILPRLLSLAAVLLLLPAAWFLWPRDQRLRLAFDPIHLQHDALAWDLADLKQRMGRAQDLVVVEKDPDISVEMVVKPDHVRTLVLDHRTGMGREIVLSRPRAPEMQQALLDELSAQILAATQPDAHAGYQVTAESLAANSRAVAQLEEGELLAAEQTLRELLSARPQDVATNLNLAMILYNQGRSSEALSLIQGALVSEPRLALAHFHHGLILLDLDRTAEATAAFEHALNLDPGHAATHHELAKLAIIEKDWDRARRHLEKALMFDPELVPALKNLGRCFLERGFPSEALTWLEQGLARVDPHDTPQRAELLFFAARAYSEADDPKRARDLVQAYTEMPHAELLPWHNALLDLAHDLGMIGQTKKQAPATWLHLPSGAPVAVFARVEGRITLNNEAQVTNAHFRTMLRPEMHIEAEADAHATLILQDGSRVDLTGPGQWSIADLLEKKQPAKAASLFLSLLPQSSRETSSIGALIKNATRPGTRADMFVLAPLGFSATAEPDLVWTASAGASAYEVTIDTDEGSLPLTLTQAELRHETFSIGAEMVQLCRLTWPDEPLWPGSYCQVRVRPIDDRRQIEEVRGAFYVLESSPATELGELLNEIDQLDVSDSATLRLRGTAYVEREIWAEAITTYEQLCRTSSQLEDGLVLTSTLIAANLDWLAQSFLETLEPRLVRPEHLARAEQDLGLLAHRRGESPDALAHWGRARALYLSCARKDLVVVIDALIDEARSRPVSHPSRE